ncbi:hypothetical protein SLS63_011846 [Diaporthe eres]|uniref:Uncharacterized protein n=1 Tax=Diaporthe eres TaxID=83184 RepID=A0ABR1NT33_DIAER
MIWRKIAPDSTHGRGCALVWAGLLPIIGEFFYECQVSVIPENGNHTDGETQLGRWFATKASLTRFQAEMGSNEKYEVRVSKFGQKKGLSAHMTSGRFDYIPLSESMAVAVRHLLLYLGSGRDRRSSYRIYHDSFSRTGEGGIREYKTLFGMVRFPWSPEPHTATTARMINLTDNDAYPAPDLDWGSASWRRFCDTPLKHTWEEIRMRHFQRVEATQATTSAAFTHAAREPARTSSTTIGTTGIYAASINIAGRFWISDGDSCNRNLTLGAGTPSPCP